MSPQLPRALRMLLVPLALCCSRAPSVAAQPAATERVPPPVRGIDVVERPGHRLPLDATLVDADGVVGPLGRFFADDDPRPALIVPGWFRCRTLCEVIAPRLRTRLAEVADWSAGEDYRVLLVSIDPREGPAEADHRRREVVGARASGWSFLTTDRTTIETLTEALGFGYRYDDATDQFAHAAVVVALTADGTVARYLYGVDHTPAALAQALAAARDHRPAGGLERVLLSCFRYTPALRRHASLIAGLLRTGGVAILLGLAAVFTLAARRATAAERRPR
jgi:protein SCO1